MNPNKLDGEIAQYLTTHEMRRTFDERPWAKGDIDPADRIRHLRAMTIVLSWDLKKNEEARTVIREWALLEYNRYFSDLK